MDKYKVMYIDGVKYIIKEEFLNKEKLEVLLAKMAVNIIKRGKSKWWIQTIELDFIVDFLVMMEM